MTPLKDVCLAQCQSPFQFLMRHGGFAADLLGCLLLGSPRRLLRRLLLGSDGTVVCGWGDETFFGSVLALLASGESYSFGRRSRAPAACLYRRGCLDVVVFTAVMSRLLFDR